MSKPTPIVVAHRGLHKIFPENTLGAFAAAAAAKIPWVECDVWPSADGVPMVIHDETLDRTTAATGPVLNYSWEELNRLQVPTLAEVMATLNRDTGFLVEIKPPDAGAFVLEVIETLRSFDGPWMVQSFDYASYAFGLIETQLKGAAFLIERADQLQDEQPFIQVDHSLVTADLVNQVRSRKGKIGAWTVNEPDEIQRMIDLGIDMLITDEPELAMRMIAK